MSKAKYILINGDRVYGIYWETEGFGNVLTTEGVLNVSLGLRIVTPEGSPVKNVDLISEFMKIVNTSTKKLD